MPLKVPTSDRPPDGACCLCARRWRAAGGGGRGDFWGGGWSGGGGGGGGGGRDSSFGTAAGEAAAATLTVVILTMAMLTRATNDTHCGYTYLLWLQEWLQLLLAQLAAVASGEYIPLALRHGDCPP